MSRNFPLVHPRSGYINVALTVKDPRDRRKLKTCSIPHCLLLKIIKNLETKFQEAKRIKKPITYFQQVLPGEQQRRRHHQRRGASSRRTNRRSGRSDQHRRRQPQREFLF